MRPSAARLGDMPGPKVYNLWWGDKTGTRQKGITTYSLSSYQSKVAPNWLRSYIFNGTRRLSGEVLFFGIPFVVGYATYTWAKGYDAYVNSKAGHLASGEHHD